MGVHGSTVPETAIELLVGAVILQSVLPGSLHLAILVAAATESTSATRNVEIEGWVTVSQVKSEVLGLEISALLVARLLRLIGISNLGSTSERWKKRC